MKKLSGMTNRMISEKSGVPIHTVDNITSGRTANPRYPTMLKIVQSMGFTLNDLYKEPQEILPEMTPCKIRLLKETCTFTAEQVEDLIVIMEMLKSKRWR